MSANLHQVASGYLAAGLCVVPAQRDKRPALATWTAYQKALPLADELDEWFAAANPHGVGIVCGAVSGGLEVLDLDAKHDPSGDLNTRARDAAREIAPGVWERCVIETTPSGGLHLYFRSSAVEGNLKLAHCPDATGKVNVIAETRGEGGFIVSAPTLGYVLTQGALTNVPLLTAEEREALLAAARSLDESPAPRPHQSSATAHWNGQELSPLDDFNTRGNPLDLLRRHGWHVGSQRADGSCMLRRPGKADAGWSATWNHAGRGTLCVFSSSTPFDVSPTTYSAAGVYAVLEHGGDYTAAARQLAREGFGALRQHPPTSGSVAAASGEPTQPPQLLTLWAPSQFLNFTPDPSACLLGNGYLELGEWTSLVGVGGLGKTRLALFLAICQITGQPWCGLSTGGVPQLTVILSTENGLRRWKHDLEKMLGSLGNVERANVEKYLRILALTPDEEGDLCLSNPEAARRLKATLAAVAPGIVVFDPFADMIDGDENKTSDVVATLRALRGVTRTACPSAAVLIIHHARSGAGNVAQAGDNFNAGNFGRGSKALFSRVRCELQLAPQDRDDPNRLVLACGKANNAAKFPARGIYFDPESFTYHVDDSFDIEAWRDDVSGKRRQMSMSIADVVGAVKEFAASPGGETSTAQVVDFLKDTGAPLRTIQRQLAAATQAGYLRKGKKRGLWRLGAKPLAA